MYCNSFINPVCFLVSTYIYVVFLDVSEIYVFSSVYEACCVTLLCKTNTKYKSELNSSLLAPYDLYGQHRHYIAVKALDRRALLAVSV